MRNVFQISAKQTASAQKSLDLPEPRIWKPEDLASFLRVSVYWVRKRTEKNAADPLPRIPGVRQIRMDTHSRLFRDWLARQLGVDSEGSDE